MSRRWTEDELRVLRRLYRRLGARNVAVRLNRSRDTFMAKAAQLGFRYNRIRPWREGEDRYLRRHYHDRSRASLARALRRTVPSIAKIALLVGRSPNAVLLYAQVLRLRRPQHDHLWTQEEHRYFVKNRKKQTYKEIARALGLTAIAVSHHASRSARDQCGQAPPVDG